MKEEIDKLVRDCTTIIPQPKSKVRRRIKMVLNRLIVEIDHALEIDGITWKNSKKATPSQVEDIIATIKHIYKKEIE